ncbi:MAG: hypothetical protein GYA51_06280 [Candidatus Methanofastidiosa archaeon]|jgi:hypothetical protein|nr:hypothetical protein [Candidatus Methanofastidiosa archaeon]
MSKIAFSLIVSFVLILSLVSLTPCSSQKEIYVISNNIDVAAKPLLEEYFRGFGVFPEFLTPENISQIKNAKLIVILGGPDAPYGTGDIVRRYLDNLEIDFIRGDNQKFTFIKPDLYGYAEKIIIIAGSERETTYDEVFSLVNGSNIEFQNEIEKAAEGKVSIKDLPLLLSGISYDTETVDREANIKLSIQNYGKGRATNVVIEISNDYYSHFNLVSTDPVVKVEGNKFYLGNLNGGEKLELNINLKAKEVGLFTGTISYSYDELESSAKIKDLKTLVP